LAADKERALPAEKKEVLTYMKENEEEMFPPTFAFSTPDGKQPEDRELFGDILTLLDELDLKSDDFDEPVKNENLHLSIVAKPKKQSADAKRSRENTRPPSDSSGDNGHPSKDIAERTVEVVDKV
jgi:hypothetical protein